MLKQEFIVADMTAYIQSHVANRTDMFNLVSSYWMNLYRAFLWNCIELPHQRGLLDHTH